MPRYPMVSECAMAAVVGLALGHVTASAVVRSRRMVQVEVILVARDATLADLKSRIARVGVRIVSGAEPRFLPPCRAHWLSASCLPWPTTWKRLRSSAWSAAATKTNHVDQSRGGERRIADLSGWGASWSGLKGPPPDNERDVGPQDDRLPHPSRLRRIAPDVLDGNLDLSFFPASRLDLVRTNS